MRVRWAHLLFLDGVWLRRSAFYVVSSSASEIPSFGETCSDGNQD